MKQHIKLFENFDEPTHESGPSKAERFPVGMALDFAISELLGDIDEKIAQHFTEPQEQFEARQHTAKMLIERIGNWIKESAQ